MNRLRAPTLWLVSLVLLASSARAEVASPGAAEGSGGGEQLQHEEEHDQLVAGEGQGLARVDAGKGDDRHQAAAVDEEEDQELDQLAEAPDGPAGVAQPVKARGG